VTEQRETWGDRAWNWAVKFIGAGVFVGAAVADFVAKATPSFYIAFFGIVLMVLPIADVRVMVRNWRRSSNGKAPES
jgi:hypothetical protein